MTGINPTLTAIAQWILVKLVPLPDGRTDKIPFNYLTRQACDAHDLANWTTYDAAAALAVTWGAGWTVGLVITAADDLFCVDVDGALQHDGTWSLLSQQIVAALPGCMVAVSQSGRGIHVWGRYPNPPAHTMKRTDLHAECYTELRFIAIGYSQIGAIAPRCDAFPAFLAEWFPPRAALDTSLLTADGPRADWRGPADDADLIRRMLASRSTASVFGSRASAADLWLRDLDVLPRCYPGDGEHGVDWSSVDAALAQHLAFWSGCDQARMVALMQRSNLVRDKWLREDYLPRTVASACNMQREVLQDRPAPTSPLAPPPALTSHTMTARDGSTFLDAAGAAQLFHQCFYVSDVHRVLCPGGRLYKPDQFNAVFGGRTFVLTADGSKTTRKAFEAFTESQVLACPVVDGTCFRPDMPFGWIHESEGRKRVNTYWPADVRRVRGDAAPFYRHLGLLFPRGDDAKILLYWMANALQNPGIKSQWMCLLVGVEGNGKTLFSRVMANAAGQRYTHWLSADKVGAQFNAYLYGRLVLLIEDVFLGGRLDLWEKLKPMITGEQIEIEGKGIDQRTDEICFNILANSNHRDALRATKNDRRIAQLWAAQQSPEDLLRDGMDDAYFSEFYRWCRADGYAIIAEELLTLAIPAAYDLEWFRGRAPRTSSSDAAVQAGLGGIEQEIIDCIEREEIGFKGGWISSKFLDDMLERLGKQRYVHINKRRELLEQLGYVWHPALVNGRVNNVVMPDGQKSKLFVLKSRSDLMGLVGGALVAEAYTRAQGVTGLPAGRGVAAVDERPMLRAAH